MKPLSACTTIGEALQTQQFQRAVAEAAPSHLTPTRLMATFRQAARNNPAFNQCNLMSVLGVFMTCTFLGLEPNTPGGQAYMIPFARKRWDKEQRKMVDDGYDLQLIPGYQGFIDIAYRNDRVTSIAAHAVFEGDDFSFEYGSNEHLQHRPKGLQQDGDQPRLFYMFSKLRNGQSFEVLPYSSVIRTRNASQGYRHAEAAKANAEKNGWKLPATFTEAPWVKHFDAMGKKTAVRAGYKWLPKTVEMAAVQRIDEAQERHLLDFGPVLEGHANPLDEDLPPLNEQRADPGAAFGERGSGEDQGESAKTATTTDTDAAAKKAASEKAQRERDETEEADRKRTADEAQKARDTAAAESAKRDRDARFAKDVADKKAADERKAAEAKAAEAKPTPEPTTTQAAAALPEFSAYLAAADGEVDDTVGEAGYFEDPVAYATAYAALRAKTDPTGWQAMAEHNSDGLEDAAQIPAAKAVFDAMPAEAPTFAAATGASETPVIGRTQIAVPMKADGVTPDLKGYLATLREHAAVQTTQSVREWSALQSAVVNALTPATKKLAQKIIADRFTATGADKAHLPQQQAQQGGGEPPDDGAPPPTEADAQGAAPSGAEGGDGAGPAWSRDAQSVVDGLMNCKNTHDVTALGNNAAIKATFAKIEAANPEESARLKALAADTRAKFHPQQGG